MKKYFDKRLIGVFLMIFVFFTAACEAKAAKSLRQKSSVLLVFNNIAGTRYDEKLTQIALEKLQKKIEGIYLEIDAEPYGENFKEKSFEKASFAELTAQVDGCGADYFVYTELQPITKETYFNFIYFVYLLQFHASGSTVIGGERTDPPVFAEAGSRVRSGCTMADRTYCAQMCSFY